MRPFEIVLPFLLVAYVVSRFFQIANPYLARLIQWLPLGAALVTLAHLALEGYRWQMILLYVLTLVLLLHSAPFLLDSTRTVQPARGWRATSAVITLILLVISAALPYLLAVPHISEPSGRYQVGTQIFTLTDESRRELYSNRNEARRFMTQIWYPASPQADDVHAPWMQDAKIYARSISENILGLPNFFLDHLVLATTPAYNGSIPKTDAGPFPIILFSHGINSFAAQSSNQMIELASQGYIVVGVQHTYGALVTIFPDGDIAQHNPDTLPDGVPDDEYDIAARKLANQWADDLDSPTNKLFNNFFPNLESSLGSFSIDGTGHYDFSDLPLLSPLAPQLGLKGPLAGGRVVEIVNAYLIGFFNATLKGEDFPLPLSSSTIYPELRWRVP